MRIVSNENQLRPGMLSIRRWEFPAFVIAGAVAMVMIASVLNHYGPAAVVLLLALPLVVIAGALAFGQGTSNIRALRRELTWWHALWFAMFLSALVFRIRDVTEVKTDLLDGPATFRLTMEALVVLGLLWRLLTRRPPWTRPLFRGLVGALAAYSLVCAVSALWSVYPSWTLYKAGEFLLDVALLSAILASMRSAREFKAVFDWTWTLYGLLLLFAWAGVVLWPSEALEAPSARLHGIFPIEGSNAIGTSGAILAIVALSRLLPIERHKQKRAWYFAILGYGVISMIMAQTRNALAGFVFAVLLILIFSHRTWMAALLSLGLSPVVLYTGLKGGLINYLQREQQQDTITSLTGRMDWWLYAWNQWLQHPLTGLGAYAAGRFGVLGKLGAGAASSLHSDYIEVLVGTSFWGMIPFLAALFGTWWWLIRSVRDNRFAMVERQLALEAIGVLGVVTIHSFFNTELCWHAPVLFLVVLGYAELLRQRRKTRVQTLEPWQYA